MNKLSTSQVQVLSKYCVRNVLKLLNLNYPFVSGFIDYIVLPTLTVIGDSLDLILGTLDIPPNARPASVPENRQSHHPSLSSNASAGNNAVLHRPWADILTENRAKWQKKHDAGKKCIRFLH